MTMTGCFAVAFPLVRIVALFIYLHAFVSSSSISTKPKERLLLISLDGFRWNYLDRTATPNFDRITNNGVQVVHGLKNAFITKTFPNHFTLVTGQWEENHGIIANYMYDPVLNKTFSLFDEQANTDAAWFNMGAEPIWVTNQLQRKDGKSGVIMWVGGGAPIKGVHPTLFMKFDADVKNESKVDTMVKWFKDDGCNLGLIYFPYPDKFGHEFGPESEEVTRVIGGLDTVIGYLLDKLEKENMLNDTNIIITSDHGFTSTPGDKVIDMSGIVDLGTFLLESSNPVAGIWPHSGFHDAIYQNLTAAAKKEGHFTVYRKADIPEYFHYKFNRRIPPIVAVADDHYSFSMGGRPYQKGNHGYDNRLQDMHPFFVAMGPAFKSGFTVDTFESVDVYPLLCHILGLNPAPNNGSMDIVKQLLAEAPACKNGTDKNHVFFIKFLEKNFLGTILAACIIVAGVTVGAVVALNEFQRRRKDRKYVLELDGIEVTTKRDNSGKLSSDADLSKTPLLCDQDFR